MGAIDGDIGKVKEFYFDDKSWSVRYLVVRTGAWLFGREVLISPDSVAKNSSRHGRFPVNLVKEQIRASPDIDTQKPISRQHEVALYGHYPWQPYWVSGFYAGGLWEASNESSVIDEKIIIMADDADNIAGEDPHLRCTRELTGYMVHAIDGETGYIKDLIIDDEWRIQYLIVDTRDWFGGKKVLIETDHIKHVQWDKSIAFFGSASDDHFA
jgi:hypothetical protein